MTLAGITGTTGKLASWICQTHYHNWNKPET